MSLGPLLATVLLLGSVPPSELSLPPAEQPQAVRECSDPQGHLTLEAFSQMARGGAFSVWDITGSVSLRSELLALGRFTGYHGTRPRDPFRANVLLQVELTPSRTGDFQQVTSAVLKGLNGRLDLQIWQQPASAGAGPRLLLAGVLDLHKLQTIPHKLELKSGEGGSVLIATLENIMFR